MEINPDLQKERETCSFKVEELTNFIHEGSKRAKRIRELADLVSKDHILSDSDWHKIYASPIERYDRALQKFVRFNELKKIYRWSEEDEETVLSIIRYDIGLGVHFIMFMPAIERLATEQQKNKWLPLAKNLKIIGTYCQTELGHGTDLRHLETQVEYDPETQEFVVNTPEKTSMKWWPGGLGLSVNHVLLLAQLYVNGTNHGLQPFVVPIRDVNTHEPLPGVEVGEIGPKMSSLVSDNGFLILKNLRIPRENMLMKYNEVTPDGLFRKLGNDQSTYGTMIFVRANICGIAWNMLSTAGVIATRYSAVRRQTEMKKGEPESQVLDYQTQQMKLFPSMAASFAILSTHRYIMSVYNKVTQKMKEGDLNQLPELHIQSAGFKALTSDLASAGAETMRRACGGHGYMLSSGLPSLVCDLVATVTYEGENTVLYLQVARYLMKQLDKAQRGSATDRSLHFLSHPLKSHPISDQSSLCMAHVDIMMEAFDRRTHYFLLEVGQTMQGDLIGGLQMHEAWNKSLVNLVRLAQMYLDGCMIHIFHTSWTETDCSPELKTVLFRLFYFHMVHRIVVNSGDFLQCGAISVDQLKAIKREEIRVLALLRPDAVGIMDAFDYTDDALGSTLGRYDGNVYEALYQTAKRSPLNEQKVHPAIKKHLLPLIRESKL